MNDNAVNKKWLWRMMMLVVAVFGVVIAVNIFLNVQRAYVIEHLPEPIHPVTRIKVQAQPLIPKISAIGFVEPQRSIMIKSEAAGFIAQMAFEDGQTIEAGQLLLELNSDVANADLNAKRVKLPSVEARYLRIKKLYQKGLASKQETERAQSDYLILKAELKGASTKIKHRQIYVPFSGMLGIAKVYVGDYVTASQDLVRLEDLTEMKIKFTISQKDVSKVAVGQQVKVYVDAYPQNPFMGKIKAIEPAVLQQSGLIEVLASIPNHNKKLLNGMFAKVQILLEPEPDQIMVPQTAVHFTLYGDTVFVVKQDDQGDLRVHETHVKIGQRYADQVHIVSGLKSGDEIVTHGLVRLRNLSRVSIQDNLFKTPEALPKL